MVRVDTIPPNHPYDPAPSGDTMTVFGPYNKNKALCACGSIADLDSKTVNTKRRLGKRVECMACRNKRIAQEHEKLERHFLGFDEEED